MTDTQPVNAGRRVLLVVLVLAFCTLMFELVISRMSVFYLNGANSFLAIPLTLFGLAVGSLRVHLGKTAVDKIDIARQLIWLTISSFLSFAAAFLLFSQLFPITHIQNPVGGLLLAKTSAFVLVFLPPFYFIGKILTALYATYRRIIGKLYGFDLAGASLGCFATPLLFHWIDLPYIIFVCLLAMTAVTAISLGRRRLALSVPFVLVALAFLPALIALEGSYNFSQISKHAGRGRLVELSHRWNEFSRVSLLRIESRETGEVLDYKIIHNNAESNVNVGRYAPDSKRYVGKKSRSHVPFLLKRPVDRVLVMFAGCGRQMIELDWLGAGKKYLVGVEINPLVMELATQTPEIADFRIQEFYDLPNVEMNAAEGRAFLDSDDRTYDYIFVASSAATTKYKTGHSRKYLDTTEALAAYLDHLSPRGLLQFSCQPAYDKIESLKKVFAARNMGDPRRHIMVMGSGLDSCAHLVVSKQPFTKRDVDTIVERFEPQLKFAPGWPGNKADVKKALRSSDLLEQTEVTDDRPFLHPLDFGQFELFPGTKKLSQHRYYRSWSKIATMLMVGFVVLVLFAGLYGFRRAKMPPASMVLYLLITGFCYMLVEITYIAKLELFLGNPLYSMALLLTIFLLTNAVGSMLYGRFKDRLNMTLMPLIVAGIILVTLVVMGAIIQQRLGMPFPIKVLVTILVISPVGVALGLFYPFVVTHLTDRDLGETVPITYGISTLSSVAGSVYAMTMIINLGYTNMIYQAAIGYIALSALMVIHNRLRR